MRFVGHPLIDLAKPRLTRDAFLKKLQPRSVEAGAGAAAGQPHERARAAGAGDRARRCRRSPRRCPACSSWSRARRISTTACSSRSDCRGVTLRIADVQTDDVLNACDAVVTASGTATVQTALHGKPMVVVYKLSPMTYRLGKPPRAGRHVRDGEPDRRRAHRRGVDPGRVHAEAVADEAVRLLTDQPIPRRA